MVRAVRWRGSGDGAIGQVSKDGVRGEEASGDGAVVENGVVKEWVADRLAAGGFSTVSPPMTSCVPRYSSYERYRLAVDIY